MKEKEILQAAILLLIVLFLVNALVPFFTGSQKPLIVLSGSMVPVMLPGDMVIARSISPNEFVVGDVMVFRDPGGKPDTLITHRVISIEEGEKRIFHTKGDANNAEDMFVVKASDVVGKLVFVIPLVGYLPDTVKHNKNIFVFTVILPAGLLILDEIRTLILYSNPAKARKVERERKKVSRRTSYVVKGHRLTAFILISWLVSTGVIVHNLGENGHVVLGKEKTIIENQGSLPLVYVLIPDDPKQRIDIHFWYGVITPANETQVTAPENTPATLSSVPYILPVFWIISLSEINPYLPFLAEVGLYTSLPALLLLPLWYRKSIIGRKSKKVKFRHLVTQWKRTLHLV